MKSFILSVVITSLICIFFVSLFDHKARIFLNNLSDKGFIVVIIIFFIGYLLSLYCGISNFKEQRLLNFLGICFSLFGLCIYAVGYMINSGGGKASPQQFDHDPGKIEITQRKALDELLQQTNTKASEMEFTYYWGMHKNPGAFVICVQKGNIIGLQIKNKQVPDIKTVSKLIHLNWLVLENCNINSITDLKLPFLDRLEIGHNRLTSLSGIGNEPKISWLDFTDNPITDSSALKDHPNKNIYIAR